MDNIDNRSLRQTAFGAPEHHRAAQYKGVTTQSLYLTMRDGVKVAIDLVLPDGISPSAKLPTVLILTRYWRSMDLRLPSQPGKAPQTHRGPIADFLGTHGYAVVVVDARGSGASFGQWCSPFSPDEIADYGEIGAWVTAQPWSNGHVGAIGISYEGSAAELLASTGLPAVKAVVPEMIEFDIFTDILFPGGIFNAWFAQEWSDNNACLDHNKLPGSVPWYVRLLVKGVRPVDVDTGRDQLRAAIAARGSNFDVYSAVKDITYRDDPCQGLNATLDEWSVFNYQDQIERSQAAIFAWGSWLDAATADTVIRRFLTFSNPQRAVIGAWDHRAEHHGSPYGPPKSAPVPGVEAQWQESLHFLDRYLHGVDDSLPDKILFYFTLGEEKWKATPLWPPAGTARQRWYLADNYTLSLQAPTSETGADTYTVDFEASTGTLNRWHTEMGEPIVYADRADMDRRLLTYTSPVLSEDMEITGYPVVTLYITSTATDGAFFVYLEDVDETGRVIYVTEGQLRALHRKVSTDTPPYALQVPYHSFKRQDAMPLVPGEVAELTFGLLPTSVLIRQGHRIRIAIAGHDKETFARVPAAGNPVITVTRNTHLASFIELPVVPPCAGAVA